MPLPRLVAFMINSVSRTTSVELFQFFNKLIKQKPITKQALSGRRALMSPQAFIKLQEILVKGYYTEDYKTYKDYIVLAIDATSLQLPNTPELLQEFGCPTTQNGKTGRPVANSSVAYDINNGIIVNGTIKPYAYSERAMAEEHIEAIKNNPNLADKKILILFDRGYPSVELMARLEEAGIDFIIRTKKKYIKETEVASKYKNYDKKKVINLSHFKKDKSSWFKSFLKEQNDKMQVRIVTGKLGEANELGIFITSLGENFSREEIVELYRNRWKIETHFRMQKESGQFENFASKTRMKIEQEYYCKLYVMNLAKLLVEEAQAKVDEEIRLGKIKSKHEIKINMNVAYGIVKDNLIRILLDNEELDYIESLIDEIAKHRIPIEKGRKFKRKFHKDRRRYNFPYRRSH